MDLGTVANLATAAAVIVGVVFGLIELKHTRREREDHAAFEVVHAILTPEWMQSVVLVQSIPDGIDPQALEVDGRLRAAAHVFAWQDPGPTPQSSRSAWTSYVLAAPRILLS